MPPLELLSDDKASPEAKAIFEKLKAKMKSVPNIFRTMGHAPQVLEATLTLSQTVQTGLDPKLRELAYIKTSMLNGCEY